MHRILVNSDGVAYFLNKKVERLTPTPSGYLMVATEALAENRGKKRVSAKEIEDIAEQIIII